MLDVFGAYTELMVSPPLLCGSVLLTVDCLGPNAAIMKSHALPYPEVSWRKKQ